MEQITFQAMGCHMLAAIDSGMDEARSQLAAVPGWFAAWERCLSRFLPDSELARLNRRADGTALPVSDVLWDVIQAALNAADQSDGLVTPTLLHALEAAGYDRSFDQLVQPAPRLLGSQAVSVPDWRAIVCDAGHRSISLPPNARLDLGGIAKGWAADQAVQHLSAVGPALVDAGGDIAVSGPQADGAPWPIAVADPCDDAEQIALLLLASGAVATSGRDHRRWRQGGVLQHHILDPRTGRPAATDVLSATVIAPNAQAAEVAAKVVMILGSQAGFAWLDARPNLAGLLVTDNGRVVWNDRMVPYLWRSDGDPFFTF